MNTTDAALESEWDPEVVDKALERLITAAHAARDAFIMGEFTKGAENLNRAQEALSAAAAAILEPALRKMNFPSSKDAAGAIPPADGGK